MKKSVLCFAILIPAILLAACSFLKVSDNTKKEMGKPAAKPAPATPAPTPEPTPEPTPVPPKAGSVDPEACPIDPIGDEEVDDEVYEEVVYDPLKPDTSPPDDPGEIPFADMSDSEIAKLLSSDPAKLGSMSLGKPNAGALFNAVPLPPGERWKIVNPAETYGTKETVDFIMASINRVHDEFENTGKVYVGDISDKDGGRLNRHVSHQSGRDADLSWYYKESANCPWWTVGDASNMDLDRTWALIRAFFTETDVQLILIDFRIQGLLYNHAMKKGEDPEWLDRVFQYPQKGGPGIIRHARGHATHVHVRFYNREAQEMGRRAYTMMIKRKMIKPPTYYVYHKVRKGQTLGHLARKYGTSVSAIKRANGLRSTMIRAGKSYKIPKRGGVRPAPGMVVVPPRKIPPPLPWEKEKPRGKTTVKVVKKTDTNAIIAGLKESDPDLLKVNPLASKDGKTKVDVSQPHLDTGDPVIVEVPTPEPTPEPTPPPPPKPKPKKKSGKKWITYKVKSGDNLWSIARRYNTHVKDIKRWNSLKSDKLKPGQKLKLYVKR